MEKAYDLYAFYKRSQVLLNGPKAKRGMYDNMRLFYNWREKKASWLFIVIFALGIPFSS